MTETTIAPEAGVKPGKPSPGQPVPWNVVLLDDDHHSYEYVIEMMQRLFHRSPQAGMLVAREVDSRGRAVCMTTHKELAELKRDQIHAFGKDVRIPACGGGMTAVIEPAQ